ncbi:hypothetical protein CEUSTIGMA_g14020.t1 [Chlamydomonas eustigma]|uniref:C3H1-type domain-containing protein n=1 Tax=Chlamydomonas eustigma TaxID=1157962 RepID=A0A250XUJ0_9CHLO|nr:hypothetical protein CEUSTIGMA_g14020.t1 [Chlamydomonas eustigma]|eukprot:GAX86612.1 hypothetical protein CEUSTIGMA_g14020.t1 [Chlamydomonas eustigma]
MSGWLSLAEDEAESWRSRGERGSRGGGRPQGAKGPQGERKTKMCLKFLNGPCTYGDRCFYAHGAHELRCPEEILNPTGPPPPKFNYLVGATLWEEEYVNFFSAYLPDNGEQVLSAVDRHQLTEDQRRRLPLKMDDRQYVILKSPGAGASGFRMQFDRQLRPVLLASHYKATSILDLSAEAVGRSLNCLSDRMNRISSRPADTADHLQDVASLGIIQISCGEKEAVEGWKRSWNLNLKAQLPVKDYLKYAQAIFIRQGPDMLPHMAEEEYFHFRRDIDISHQMNIDMRSYCRNWGKVTIKVASASPCGPFLAPSSNSMHEGADRLAEELSALSVGRSQASTTPHLSAGSDPAAPLQPAPQQSDDPQSCFDKKLSQHFQDNFFELPEELQPLKYSNTPTAPVVRWFGCTKAPVILAMPLMQKVAELSGPEDSPATPLADKAAQLIKQEDDWLGWRAEDFKVFTSARNSSPHQWRLAEVNSLGSVAAAQVAQAFVKKFGPLPKDFQGSNEAGDEEDAHRQQGFGLFFVPMYEG